MSKLLAADEIQTNLAKLDLEWATPGQATLTRVFNFDDFKQALAFVNKIGDLAEELNHHPDIELNYGKVVVNLTTHSAGGLTSKDFELANQIDQLVS